MISEYDPEEMTTIVFDVGDYFENNGYHAIESIERFFPESPRKPLFLHIKAVNNSHQVFPQYRVHVAAPYVVNSRFGGMVESWELKPVLKRLLSLYDVLGEQCDNNDAGSFVRQVGAREISWHMSTYFVINGLLGKLSPKKHITF